MDEKTLNFIKSQINSYCYSLPLYEQYCEILKKILTHIIGGYSSEFMIEGKTKTIYGFIDEIFNSNINNSNVTEEMNDLIGLKIILPNLDELNTVSKLMQKHFIIIKENEKSKTDKLELQELLKNFIVELNPKSDLYNRLELHVPDEIFGLKAEIQIRTFLQHGWEVNKSGSFYKTEFKIPKPYIREFNRIKALLETADISLNTLIKKMRDYESSYGAYMSNERIKDEIKKLELVYSANKNDFDIVHKIAKLAMAINEWDKTIVIIENILKIDEWKKYPDLKQASVLRDLGIALYKKNKNNPRSSRYVEGQSYLKTAVEKNPMDSDAFASLGGSYKILKDYEKAYKYYKKALKADPSHPYPLLNYLIMKIQKTGNLKHIKYNKELIQKGIERRLNQIEVKVEIPWAFFDMGLFSFFLGKLDDSLIYYLNGINHSQNMWMIDTTLNTLDELKNIHNQMPGIELIRSLLLLGILFHPNKNLSYNQKMYSDALKKLDNCMEIKENDLKDPIVIIAGGTDARLEKLLQNYKNTLTDGFCDFKGSIISGGTKSGICRIVGDIQEKYLETIKTIGYIPHLLPYDIKIDERYKKIHSTIGTDFSILEALQYWYDILKSGLDHSNVKLIGINGGKIAALEYRMAIAFGAQVAIIKNSGREASELINDKNWLEKNNIKHLEKPKRLFKVINNTSEEIHEFLTKPFTTDPDIENLRKLLIQHIHGASIYEKDFSDISQPGDLMSGLLSAIQSFASEIGFGEIPILSAEGGAITMTPFRTEDFRIFFFLFEKPSKSLTKKIEDYTKICEEELMDDFKNLQQVRSYRNEKRMAEIMSRVFGQEILKFFENI